MTLDRFRPLADRLVAPAVTTATALGLSANAVSAAALVVAGAAGLAFARLESGAVYPLAGSALVALNGYLDVVDGELARRRGDESAFGDLLDHVFDRYADIVVVAGLAVGADRLALGLAAVTGVLMTSYLGTQSQAVGLDRVYAGLLGRADRLVLVGVAGAATPFVGPAFGLGPVGWLLVVFAVAGHLTALQRFYGAWRELA